MSVQIFCFILCSALLTRRKIIRLFNTIFALTTQKRSRFEFGHPSPLFVATPLLYGSLIVLFQQTLTLIIQIIIIYYNYSFRWRYPSISIGKNNIIHKKSSLRFKNLVTNLILTLNR